MRRNAAANFNFEFLLRKNSLIELPFLILLLNGVFRVFKNLHF